MGESIKKDAKLAIDTFNATGLTKVAHIPLVYQQVGAIYQKMIGASSQQISMEDVPDLVNIGMWPLAWLRSGLPSFSLSKAAFAGFALTKAGDCTSDVKFPFDSFAISVPDNMWQVSDMSGHECSGVSHVWFYTYLQIPKTEYNGVGTKTEHITLQTLINPRSVEKWVCYGVRNFDGVDLWRRFPAHEFLSGAESPGCGGYSPDNSEAAIYSAVRNIILNLSIYAAENKRDVKKKKNYSRKRKSKKNKITAKPQVWIIGSKIKLDDNVVNSARSDNGIKTAWRLKTRFTVRGHWRMQACGVGRVERKRIWIKPFWKGPRGGDRVSHLYEHDHG